VRCEDLAERITDLLEGDVSPEEEEAAIEHLAGCSRCEVVLAETRDVISLTADHGAIRLTSVDRARMLGAIQAQATTSTGEAQTSE